MKPAGITTGGSGNHFRKNTHFKIRYSDGDCGITLVHAFRNKRRGSRFGDCLKAGRHPLGPSLHCKNMVLHIPIKSKKLMNEALPPFGKGFDGENTEYDPEKCCKNTDRIVERYVATGIGPQYSENDIGDMIGAIEKVDSNLYSI